MSSTDETLAVLQFLQAQAALTAITSTRIWADVDQPDTGYTPSNGAAICFKVRGGIDGDPVALMHPSFQFKIYGANEVTARAAARALHDAFDGKANKDILTVYRETLPVTLQEPEAGWIYCLVFYQVMIRHLN